MIVLFMDTKKPSDKKKLLKRAIRVVDALILNLENVSKNQAMFDISMKQLTAQVISENEWAKSLQKSSPQINEEMKRLIKFDTEVVDQMRSSFAQIDTTNQAQVGLVKLLITYYKMHKETLIHMLEGLEQISEENKKKKFGVAGI